MAERDSPAESLAMAELDPQVARLLAGALRAQPPSVPGIGAVAARAHYARAVRILDQPERALHAVHDHALELPQRRLRLRQYVPVEHSWAQPQPALLFFHGGGFTIGSIDTHDRLCRQLAADAGCQVCSLEYRLAPEHRFPAAVDDAFESLHWLLAEAPALGIDPARLAVGGDSAGGTLATATALHARDQGIALRLQLLIYPGLAAHQDSASHRAFARGVLLDAELIQWFFGHYLRSPADREDWRFAPLNAPRLAGVAPVWLALAGHDPLRDEGLAYAERLRAEGVPVDCRVYPGMIHAFFQHAGFVLAARRGPQEAAAALRAALRDTD